MSHRLSDQGQAELMSRNAAGDRVHLELIFPLPSLPHLVLKVSPPLLNVTWFCTEIESECSVLAAAASDRALFTEIKAAAAERKLGSARPKLKLRRVRPEIRRA